VSVWGTGREPAPPSGWPEPVGPVSSGPTGSVYQPAVGSAPVVPRPPDLGPVHPPAAGSAPVVPVSAGPAGRAGPAYPPEPAYASGPAYAPEPAYSAGPVYGAGSPPVVVRRPRWVVPALAAMGAVTLAALTVASWALARSGIGFIGGGTTLAEAHQTCGSRGDLSDGGRTLYLDMKGEDPGSGTLTWRQVECYLTALNTPEYVLRHMQSTRALDGRQSATWDMFEASWTYHPDDGLDVLIRQVT
jgi:hypothetical protein